MYEKAMAARGAAVLAQMHWSTGHLRYALNELAWVRKELTRVRRGAMVEEPSKEQEQ